MGAVYEASLKDLQKVLRCGDREMRDIGRKMSEIVIAGSMEILRRNAHEVERGTHEEGNVMIEEEVRRLEEAAIEGNEEIEGDIERNERERGRDRNNVIKVEHYEEEEHEVFGIEEDLVDELERRNGVGNEARIGFRTGIGIEIGIEDGTAIERRIGTGAFDQSEVRKDKEGREQGEPRGIPEAGQVGEMMEPADDEEGDVDTDFLI
jgi:hypothetical protein